MKSQLDNKHKLNHFFNAEYQDLKKYVKSRIAESADRDAEDIIQDVALNLFSRNNGSPISNVAGFVYGSVRNKIIDIMRTRKQSTDIQMEDEHKVIDLMDWLYSDADNAYSDEMQHQLKTAITRLHPNYQAVILAIDFERLSYKELALETGISAGTLMSRRHRALAILHHELKQEKNNNY